jgi:hypothetical protein
MPGELDRLIAAHFDGTLDAVGRDELCLRLRSDPAAARTFADAARLEAGLAARFGGSSAWSGRHAPLPGLRATRPARLRACARRPSGSTWWPLAVAAALVVIVGGVWLGRATPPQAASVVAAEGRLTVTAIVGSAAVIHEGRPMAVEPGTVLAAGMRLSSPGDAQVTLAMDDGSTIGLSGPAELNVQSAAFSLEAGRLRADIMPQATPLRFLTAQAEVTVIGTAFDLVARPEATDCALYHGRLSVTRIADRRHVLLEADQRLEITAQGGQPLIASAITRRPAADSALIAWYPLDEDLGRDASGHDRRLTLGGGRQAPGRFGGALACAGQTRAVSADGMAFGPDLTISGWFRVADPGATSVLVGANGMYAVADQTNVHDVLFLGLEDGRLKAGTDLDHDWRQHAVLGRSSVTPATWHHAALTLRHGVAVAVYLDGRLEQQAEITGNQPFVGRIVLGCSDAGWAQQWFQGELDEVRIYNRALTDQEIQGLAEVR